MNESKIMHREHDGPETDEFADLQIFYWLIKR